MVLGRDEGYRRALFAVLRTAREAQGISRRDLARKLGFRDNFVSMVESGQRALRVYELPDYAAELGLTSIELMARMEAEYALHYGPSARLAIRRVRARVTAKKAARSQRK